MVFPNVQIKFEVHASSLDEEIPQSQAEGKNEMDVENNEESVDNHRDDGRASSRLSVRHSSRVKESQKHADSDTQDCDSFLGEFIPDDYETYESFKTSFEVPSNLFGPLKVDQYLHYLQEMLSNPSKKITKGQIRQALQREKDF